MPRRLFSRRWSPSSPAVPASPENTPALGLPPFPPLCSSWSCGISVSQINSAPGTRPHGGTLAVPGTRGRDGGLSPGWPGFPVTPFRPVSPRPGRLRPLLGSVPHGPHPGRWSVFTREGYWGVDLETPDHKEPLTWSSCPPDTLLSDRLAAACPDMRHFVCW